MTSSQTNYRLAAPKWILLLRTSELYSTYSKHIRGLKLIEGDWIWKDINREDMKNLLKMNLSKLLWNSATGQSLEGRLASASSREMKKSHWHLGGWYGCACTDAPQRQDGHPQEDTGPATNLDLSVRRLCDLTAVFLEKLRWTSPWRRV